MFTLRTLTRVSSPFSSPFSSPSSSPFNWQVRRGGHGDGERDGDGEDGHGHGHGQQRAGGGGAALVRRPVAPGGEVLSHYGADRPNSECYCF